MYKLTVINQLLQKRYTSYQMERLYFMNRKVTV